MQSDDELKKIYKIFVNWYAMPETTRQPKTIPEFCENFGIDKPQIYQFTQHEDFTDDVYTAAIKWGKSKVPELLHMLYEKYTISKNPNDLRMYKELLNIDRGQRKEDTDDARDRKGLLRELFDATR